MNQNNFFVYIILNKNNNMFYVGLTNNLVKKMLDYGKKEVELVYHEKFDSIENALNREKQIKKFSRNKKIKLFS